MEDTNALTPSESEFFESGGETDLPENDTAEESSTVAEDSTPAQEETPQEDAPQEQERTPQQKTVPLAALHQARAELKELKAWKQQQEQVLQQIYQKMNPEPQIPSLEDDPVTHFALKNQQLEQNLHQMQEFQRQQYEAQRAQQEDQQFRAQVAQLEADFVKKTPDYLEAAHYLREQIANDLYVNGVDPNEIGYHVDERVKGLIVQAANMGVHPSEFAYNLAKSKGFKGKQSLDTTKIQSIQKGQNAAKSLSSTGGKAKGEITLEALAEMDDTELAKNWHLLKKLM